MAHAESSSGGAGMPNSMCVCATTISTCISVAVPWLESSDVADARRGWRSTTNIWWLIGSAISRGDGSATAALSMSTLTLPRAMWPTSTRSSNVHAVTWVPKRA